MNIQELAASDFPGVDAQKFEEWKALQLRFLRLPWVALTIMIGVSVLSVPLIGGAIGWALPVLSYFVFMFTQRAQGRRLRQLGNELGMRERLKAYRERTMNADVRTLVLVAAGLSLGCAAAQPSAKPGSTYVIVHGAWGGGWDWRAMDSLLTAQGNRVHRVTLTGLGERVHLAARDIGLTTHINDVVNSIAWEGLKDVVLVGHSYGGMVITGTADRIPERIRALIYIDAFLPESGESVLRLTGDQGAAFFSANTKDGLIVPPWATAEMPIPKDVPHPLKTFADTLKLTNAAARNVKGSYILTIEKGATRDDFSLYADRAKARGWPVHQLTADHVPERSARAELLQLMLQVP